MDGYLLMAFLRSWLTSHFLLFSELSVSSPEKGFGLEAVHFSRAANSWFFLKWARVHFVFVCECWGRGERRYRRATQSVLVWNLCSWKFPLLCFGGDDLPPPAVKLFGKVVLTPLSCLIWDGNESFILSLYCQPLLHPVLGTSCVYCMTCLRLFSLKQKSHVLSFF